jgi:hypothetical protein
MMGGMESGYIASGSDGCGNVGNKKRRMKMLMQEATRAKASHIPHIVGVLVVSMCALSTRGGAQTGEEALRTRAVGLWRWRGG